MNWVVEARALPNYAIWVRFNDGVEGQVTLRDLVMTDTRPIVCDLREPDRFAALKVEHDTVVWDNGFDLAPEYLRANLTRPASA